MARILLAEDDTDIRDLVSLMLTTAGHQVTAVPDGTTALEAAQREHPELAILDVMMPGMSGFEVCRAIRADESLVDVKVMMLTARTQASDIEEGFACGANDYMVKPFSPSDLTSRVKDLTESVGSE